MKNAISLPVMRNENNILRDSCMSAQSAMDFGIDLILYYDGTASQPIINATVKQEIYQYVPSVIFKSCNFSSAHPGLKH